MSKILIIICAISILSVMCTNDLESETNGHLSKNEYKCLRSIRKATKEIILKYQSVLSIPDQNIFGPAYKILKRSIFIVDKVMGLARLQENVFQPSHMMTDSGTVIHCSDEVAKIIIGTNRDALKELDQLISNSYQKL